MSEKKYKQLRKKQMRELSRIKGKGYLPHKESKFKT